MQMKPDRTDNSWRARLRADSKREQIPATANRLDISAQAAPISFRQITALLRIIGIDRHDALSFKSDLMFFPSRLKLCFGIFARDFRETGGRFRNEGFKNSRQLIEASRRNREKNWLNTISALKSAPEQFWCIVAGS